MPKEFFVKNIDKDIELLESLAKWLRKHDCGAFADDNNDQEDAEKLLEDIANWLKAMKDIASYFPFDFPLEENTNAK